MTTDRHTPLTPHDLLADGADGIVINGTFVRKGSIGSFIQSVMLLPGLSEESEEFRAIADQIRAITPALDAVGLFEVFEVRDPRVAAILAEAR